MHDFGEIEDEFWMFHESSQHLEQFLRFRRGCRGRRRCEVVEVTVQVIVLAFLESWSDGRDGSGRKDGGDGSWVDSRGESWRLLPIVCGFVIVLGSISFGALGGRSFPWR